MNAGFDKAAARQRLSRASGPVVDIGFAAIDEVERLERDRDALLAAAKALIACMSYPECDDLWQEYEQLKAAIQAAEEE